MFNDCHISLPLSGVSAGVNLRKNYQDEVIVREGESVELVCSADKEVGQCTWETADGRYRPFYPGAKYPRLSKVSSVSTLFFTSHVWSQIYRLSIEYEQTSSFTFRFTYLALKSCVRHTFSRAYIVRFSYNLCGLLT